MIGASGGEGDGGEYLIILEPAAATEALEQLRSSHRVIQVGSPRVIVVAVSPGETPPSAATPGVVAVSGGALPADMVEELDEQEALFLAAWTSRMTSPEKQRRGTAVGCSWLRATRPAHWTVAAWRLS